jgi:gliding motility-associated-like protein
MLYEQFNGRYDFTFVGNTLNPQENSFQPTPVVNTSSSADLTLQSGDVIQKAYLYWAGSGTGDYNVLLNGQPVVAERTFAYQRIIFTEVFDYFSAFADVTPLVQSAGNGNYTLSGLDVTAFIEQHFQTKTNFAGWALIIVYENVDLPLNQLNIYDGLQAVPTAINITLSSLNVIDNQDAKIGFLAWEGDVDIQVNETLRINNTPLSNPPLNPESNAFNGTNSFTGSNTLYNMDLDVYGIQNNIQIGDSSADIQLTSNQDFVMINAIVTKLNSQVPDATITIENVVTTCNSLTIVAEYTVYNLESTNPLPANVPIAIYANGILLAETTTGAAIPIGGSQTGQITITLPVGIPAEFDLQIVVDDDGQGNGTVTELNEDNNSAAYNVILQLQPPFNAPPPLIVCNAGTTNTFDFSHYEDLIVINPGDTVQFFESEQDAEDMVNPILNPGNYQATEIPHTLFVRVGDADCYAVTSFELRTRNCPPVVYNYVSVNNDGLNDTFHIDGLRDIFLNHTIDVYNRWGALVWSGNNHIPEWDGIATKGTIFPDGKIPDGTYYYVLHLNDPDYPEPMKGFLYLVH